MGKNNKPRTTVTRSISFAEDVFEAMEARRQELRMERSEFIKAVLEDILGFLPHPELKDLKRKAKR